MLRENTVQEISKDKDVGSRHMWKAIATVTQVTRQAWAKRSLLLRPAAGDALASVFIFSVRNINSKAYI
jgi:hypothetical protein